MRAHRLQKRDDIQGLRALAVLSVIFYHFQISGFAGGFVGVDVFFVISGYLISSKLAREVNSGAFNFEAFLKGRVRRLLPALLVTIALTFAVGAILFAPADFKMLSGSTIAALFSLSNVTFWYEADYFDVAAILKPLLHTWSLAVETQFYLVWPLVILIVARRKLLPSLIGITVGSLLLAVVMVNHDQSGAFFLTPFRIWEFSAGGLVYALETRLRLGRRSSDALYFLGVISVLLPIFTYSEGTQFPGLSAIPPIVGTALMLLSGPTSRLTGVLQTKSLVFLGEISYSVYLVHWPLVVFVQYTLVRELNWLDQTTLLVVTLILSVSLYYFVEEPFRKPNSIRSIRPSFIYAMLMAAVIIPASTSYSGDGWAWRTPESIRNINKLNIEHMKDYVWAEHRKLRGENFAHDGKLKVLIIGDSMSGDFVNILNSTFPVDKLSVRTMEVLRFCAAMYIPQEKRDQFWRSENNFTAKANNAIAGCEKDQRDIFQSQLVKDADVIFVANFWYEWAMPYLDATLKRYQSLTDAQIFFLGRKDLLRSSISFVNERQSLNGLEQYAAQFRDPETEKINNTMRKQLQEHFIDLMPLVCPTEIECSVVDSDNHPLFWDKSHITPEGAKLLGRRLSENPLIKKLTEATMQGST